MTVGEAKSRMSYPEAMRWAAYFKKHGYASLSQGSTPEIQRGFALLASILINVNGGYKNGNKAKVEDFLPSRLGEQEGGVEDVAALLSSLWSGNAEAGRKRKLWKRASSS